MISITQENEETDLNSLAQSERNKHGNRYEREIYEFVLEGLKNDPTIEVTSPGKTSKNKELRVVTQLGSFIPDVDILISDKKSGIPIIVISTKTTLRERVALTAYALRLLRDRHPKLIGILVAECKDEFEKKSGKLKTPELGSDSNPNRPRIAALYENIRIFVDNEKIPLGIGVRPRSELIDYIKGLI
jgi:hypothetical protein